MDNPDLEVNVPNPRPSRNTKPQTQQTNLNSLVPDEEEGRKNGRMENRRKDPPVMVRMVIGLKERSETRSIHTSSMNIRNSRRLTRHHAYHVSDSARLSTLKASIPGPQYQYSIKPSRAQGRGHLDLAGRIGRGKEEDGEGGIGRRKAYQRAQETPV